jgi:hypothetical protein
MGIIQQQNLREPEGEFVPIYPDVWKAVDLSFTLSGWWFQPL